MFALSKEVDCIGPLSVDLCNQARLIPNGVDLLLRLYPNNQAFVIMAETTGKTFRLNILECRLKIFNVEIHPNMQKAQQQLMTKVPAMYPFYNSHIKTYPVPAGTYSFNIEDLFPETVPNSCIITFVQTQSYSGTPGSNPFNFANFDINFVEFTVDGDALPEEGWHISYENPEAPTNPSRQIAEPLAAIAK